LRAIFTAIFINPSLILKHKMTKHNQTEFAGKGDKCTSCNTSVVNDQGSVKFNCPGCAKYMIVRCAKCRKIVTKYVCPGCGFEGPN
jgi:Zn-ribbon RNA-binding protein